MSYYQRQVTLSTTPVRDNVKFLKIIRSRTKEWMEEFNAEGGLERFVENYLSERFERVVCTAAGLEERFGKMEVIRDSPLHTLLGSAIEKSAKAFLAKMLPAITLRDKDIASLQKHAKEEYMEVLYRKVGRLAEERAEKDAQATFSDLLETTLEQASVKRRRDKTTNKVVRVVKLKVADDKTARKGRR